MSFGSSPRYVPPPPKPDTAGAEVRAADARRRYGGGGNVTRASTMLVPFGNSSTSASKMLTGQ